MAKAYLHFNGHNSISFYEAKKQFGFNFPGEEFCLTQGYRYLEDVLKIAKPRMSKLERKIIAFVNSDAAKNIQYDHEFYESRKCDGYNEPDLEKRFQGMLMSQLKKYKINPKVYGFPKSYEQDNNFLIDIEDVQGYKKIRMASLKINDLLEKMEITSKEVTPYIESIAIGFLSTTIGLLPFVMTNLSGKVPSLYLSLGEIVFAVTACIGGNMIAGIRGNINQYQDWFCSDGFDRLIPFSGGTSLLMLTAAYVASSIIR